jgi:hypothetical protein
MRTVLAVLAGVVACAACGSKGEGAKACAQYKDAFLESCVATCAAKVDRGTCVTKCAEELPKDKKYGPSCVLSGSPASASLR